MLDEELDVWASRGVEGHFDHPYNRPWLTVDEECCRLMAPIVGAEKSEIAIMASLSTNIHLLLVAFYQPTETRYKILIEDKAFPSDYFIVQSQIELHGLKAKDALLLVKPREGEEHIRTEDILKLVQEEGSSIAVIMLSGVQFLSGQLFPMKEITEAGHAAGCYVGFDLAHAAGNVPLSLHEWNIDFAAWCTYKYLNAGPGGIAGLFIHSRHNDNKELKILRGWWGTNKETRFEMDHVFDGIPGAKGFQHSNPNVMAMTCLLSSLQVFSKTSMEAIREKSFRLVTYFRQLVSGCDSLIILTSDKKDKCGAQLSIKVPYVPIDDFMKAIHAEGVMCDARKNQVIRIAFTGLYNTYDDVYRAATILKAHCQKPSNQ